MAEIRECATCFSGDILSPDIKCCFNCACDPDSCLVTHHCGKDCPKWKPRTNANHIRRMSDTQLSALLCSTGWRLYQQKECLEWLKQPVESFII